MPEQYPTQGSQRPKDLSREADRLLRANGYDIFARPLDRDTYLQTRFEDRMPRAPFRGASRTS